MGSFKYAFLAPILLEPKYRWVDANMQAFRPAFALAASLIALQGCAGINELAYGDLLARPPGAATVLPGEFIPRDGGSVAASFNQTQS